MRTTFPSISRILSCCLLLMIFLSEQAFSVSWTPAGLGPDDKYRIVFVTDGTTTASSSDIDTYNAFVNAEGLAATGITGWKIIGSTTDSAILNTDTPVTTSGIPIFLIDDANTKIADNYVDFWDGSIDAKINVTATGAAPPTYQGSPGVWAGTLADGESFPLARLGRGQVSIGTHIINSTTQWIRWATGSNSFLYPLYAISPVLANGAPVPTYSIGGNVSDLTGTGLALQNNGGYTLAVTANGGFTFATELTDTSAYAVTVSTQPTGQTCTVTNGSGNIAAANVTDVAVVCADDVVPTYSVGGNVSGLTGTGLALQNNGADTLPVTTDGSFAFVTELVDTTAYAVTVSTQPSGQTCSVTNDSGTIATADVTNVGVTCVDDPTFTFSNVSYTPTTVTFTIDGDMSGYNTPPDFLNQFSMVYGGDIWAGLPNFFSNFWSRSVFDNKTIAAPGTTGTNSSGAHFTVVSFNPASLADATASNVTVTVDFKVAFLDTTASSPTITFVWGNGTPDKHTILETVTPSAIAPPATYTVGGTVSGLTGAGLELQNMGADTLPVPTDGPFTFDTALEVGFSYVVTVSTQPTGQTCTVSNGSGTISNANVTDVAVDCADNPEPLYTINGTVSGLGPISVVLQNNGTDNLEVDANGVFVFDTALSDGSPYDVTVLTQPAGQTCGVTNGSGTVNGSDVLGVDVGCQDDVVVPPVLPTEPIPVMSEWALILLTMFLGLMVFANRRRLF